ncbi:MULTISPECIES: hypothetical protein [Actinomadura]|jgi:hypothetical protein|uniref:Uncharacterized protein n=1 Tax=Actinomadura geliboluensis TaxID=882440 RepID=A0A5S4G9I3_9ACTN|nr:MULTISPECIES: hypothetical protein [Actinomadura]QKW35725.1 hypothetical protein HUT06_18160 [Actinomadura sp. NAK00032]TMR29678.1 hypothetical protein ETD96_35120 [Actinomadura geliboluensis]
MFEIWETSEPARLISDAGSLKVALEKVDTMCRLRHDQAVAHVGDAGRGYHFEIRDPEGKALARLSYVPDTSRAYQSVVVEEMRGDKHGGP